MIDQEPEESFAELFEQSLKKPPRELSPGQKVTGTVMQVGAARVIVDLGDGLDGIVEMSELADHDGQVSVKKGDKVELYVTQIDNRVATLAKSLGKGPGARLALEEAYRSGVPVEGTVAEVNKGGYVVEVAGARCFCPMGQMDTRRIEDPATMIGQHLQFRVTELRGSRDVVLSRRALMEADAALRASKTRELLSVGARFTGTVTSVRDFGAFVDIGGMDGLVPASELTYGRKRPQDVVQVGQTVDVEVLRVEPPGPKDRSERITLSMRALAADPWETSISDLTEGDLVKGIVQRVQPFGAFVEIVPGVDGLVHVSAFGKRIAHPSDMVTPGDEVAVRIDNVDRANKRISLTYVAPEELAGIVGEVAEEPAPEAEAIPEPPSPSVAVAETKDSAAPARPERSRGTEDREGGLKVRRVGKAPAKPEVEKKPAPAPKKEAPAAKPKVLGRSANVPAESSAATSTTPAAPRKPEDLAAPPVGTVLEVTVDKIETFGLFVKWTAGRGLVPASELETPKGADLRKAFPVGTAMKVAVIEVRGDGKVRLSATAATQAEERQEARSWMQSQKPAGGKGFGTLGDLLAKFKK